MPEKTAGQVLDDLAFRIGRLENWVKKWDALQGTIKDTVRGMAQDFNGITKAIVETGGHKLVNLRGFAKYEKGLKTFTYNLGLKVACPGCPRRFKSYKAVRSHITSDANWRSVKFRRAHKKVRDEMGWRPAGSPVGRRG